MAALLKVFSDDCVVCSMMSEFDAKLASQEGFEMSRIDLGALAAKPEGDPVRDWVVDHHLDKSDGTVKVPIYIILDGEKPKASAVVKDVIELNDLFKSWEASKAQQSRGSMTM